MRPSGAVAVLEQDDLAAIGSVVDNYFGGGSKVTAFAMASTVVVAMVVVVMAITMASVVVLLMAMVVAEVIVGVHMVVQYCIGSQQCHGGHAPCKCSHQSSTCKSDQHKACKCTKVCPEGKSNPERRCKFSNQVLKCKPNPNKVSDCEASLYNSESV